MKRAVFLDRDGTLIEEVGYLDRLEQIAFFPFSVDAVRLLNRAGFAVIVVTNQSGVARGLFDEAFVERMASYMPNFEIYLQFDSFERDALMRLRGADLRGIREKALERLNRHNLSTTLVVTVIRDNAPARALYAGLGMTEAGDYYYRVAPDG